MSRQDKRGRDKGRPSDRLNTPPADEPWGWLTVEMMASPAWCALSLRARHVIDRLQVEHGRHAGTQNGNLVVSYAQFEAAGVRQGAVPEAIREAVALGFVEVTEQGRRAYGIAKRASRYRLTWYPWRDGETTWPASNPWKAIKTAEEAQAAKAAAQAPRPGPLRALQVAA